MRFVIIASMLLGLAGCADPERRAALGEEVAALEASRNKLTLELAELKSALARTPGPTERKARVMNMDELPVDDAAYRRLAKLFDDCASPCTRIWRMKARNVENWAEVSEGMRKSFMSCASRCNEKSRGR